MKTILAVWALLLGALVAAATSLPAPAQVMTGVSNFVVGTSAPPSYTGPGDIQSSGWVFFGSFRAFKASTIAGTSVVNVQCASCTPSNQDFKANADGSANLTGIETYCGGSGNPNGCTAKFYDQSGAANTMSAAMKVSFACAGSSKPPICLADTVAVQPSISGMAISQPISIIGAFLSTTSDGGGGNYVCPYNYNGNAQCFVTNGPQEAFGHGTPNQHFITAGTNSTPSPYSANTWYADAGVFNGASSLSNFNGTTWSGNAGTNSGVGATFFLNLQNSAICPGSICVQIAEIGALNVALAAPTIASLVTNVRSNNGGF